MSISLDNLSYFKIKNIPDPKNLICCICYCLINKNGKQCKNNKCLKIYCEDCYLKLKFQNEPCSYCRISKDYIGLDTDIITCLENLLFFCPEFNCKEQYTLEEYKTNHIHKELNEDNNNNITKCNICQFILDKNPNCLTCNICNSKYCFRNVEYIPYKINKTRIKKFLKPDDICMKRCINCLTPICNKCNMNLLKKNLNNFICNFCEIKCSLCSNNNSITFCDSCHEPICDNCFKFDEKNGLILCNKDYNEKSNKKIEKYFVLDKYEKCPICNNKINDINDLVKCKETKCKNKFICYKCALFCNICKKITCTNCSIYCNQCSQDLSLVSCKSCNSNTIKKCSKENCDNNLCINCYNSCNYCNIILCDKHKNQCLNCQDTMCENHFSICNICDKERYKKACLKKCTYKCAFCDNMNNELCNKNNHEKNFVQKYNCEHNICLNCVKKCEKCKKIVKSCPRCTVNFYFEHCDFCEKYQCFTCGKQCNRCEDYYCDFQHKCNICNQIIKENTCLKCINITRMKCCACKKQLKGCDECKKLLICSRECYLKNRNKMQHICQMFACDDCLNKNGTVDIYNIKEQEVLINVNLNEFINNNTSGRNMDKNQSMNIFNNQTNPNLSINKDKNNGVKGEKRKTFCCCDYCFIF